VRSALKRWPVDQARIYATGLSLGGFGVWAAASANPGLFAAVVPICGGFTLPVSEDLGLTALLNRAKLAVKAEEIAPLRNLPVWLFHGDRDKIVDVNGSKAAFDAMSGAEHNNGKRRRLDARLAITIYKDMGHHCWKTAYSNPELYKWLLQHRLQMQAIEAEPTSRRSALPKAAAKLLGVHAQLRPHDGVDIRHEDMLHQDLHEMQPLLPIVEPVEQWERVTGEEDDESGGEEEAEEDKHRKRVAWSMRALIRRAHPAAKLASRTAGAVGTSNPGGGGRDVERAHGEKRKLE